MLRVCLDRGEPGVAPVVVRAHGEDLCTLLTGLTGAPCSVTLDQVQNGLSGTPYMAGVLHPDGFELARCSAEDKRRQTGSAQKDRDQALAWVLPDGFESRP